MTTGGFGVIAKIEVSSVLTAIANVLEIDMPEFEKFLAESTSHGSTGGYSEFVATGQRQVNEFKMTLGWDDSASTHAAIIAGFNSDLPVNMEITSPDAGEVIAFAAHIQKIGRIGKMKDAYKCDVTVQPTGQPTIT